MEEDYPSSWYRGLRYVKSNISIERSEEIEKNDEGEGGNERKETSRLFLQLLDFFLNFFEHVTVKSECQLAEGTGKHSSLDQRL
jgi:hypothetical protein